MSDTTITDSTSGMDTITGEGVTASLDAATDGLAENIANDIAALGMNAGKIG